MRHATSENERSLRRLLTRQIKDSLRDLRNQLAMLNRQVGAHLGVLSVEIRIMTRSRPFSARCPGPRCG
jgi:hypothetical protein